jgi:hypothetical protein
VQTTNVVITDTGSYNHTDVFGVGYFPPGVSEFFRGALDELRVWNRMPDNDEVLANHARRIPPVQAGLMGLWRTWETNAATVPVDMTQRGHALTAVGSDRSVRDGPPIRSLTPVQWVAGETTPQSTNLVSPVWSTARILAPAGTARVYRPRGTGRILAPAGTARVE